MCRHPCDLLCDRLVICMRFIFHAAVLGQPALGPNAPSPRGPAPANAHQTLIDSQTPNAGGFFLRKFGLPTPLSQFLPQLLNRLAILALLWTCCEGLQAPAHAVPQGAAHEAHAAQAQTAP